MTYILRGIDLTLIRYADDVMNLSHFFRELEDIFIKLQLECAHIGLHFTAEKSSVMLFNWKCNTG